MTVYPITHGYRPILDIDLGLGRQYGYRNPAAAGRLCPPLPPARPAECHPDRPMHARRKCRYCYDRGRKAAQ